MPYGPWLIIALWIDQFYNYLKFHSIIPYCPYISHSSNSPLNLLLNLLVPSLIDEWNKASTMSLFYICMRFMILPFFLKSAS